MNRTLEQHVSTRSFAAINCARCGHLRTDVIVEDGGGNQVGEESRRQDTRYGQRQPSRSSRRSTTSCLEVRLVPFEPAMGEVLLSGVKTDSCH
jgi:hypothetical protein